MRIYRLRKGEMMGNNEDILIAAILITAIKRCRLKRYNFQIK